MLPISLKKLATAMDSSFIHQDICILYLPRAVIQDAFQRAVHRFATDVLQAEHAIFPIRGLPHHGEQPWIERQHALVCGGSKSCVLAADLEQLPISAEYERA